MTLTDVDDPTIPCPNCSEPMHHHDEDTELDLPESMHCGRCRIAIPMESLEDPDYDAGGVGLLVGMFFPLVLGLCS